MAEVHAMGQVRDWAIWKHILQCSAISNIRAHMIPNRKQGFYNQFLITNAQENAWLGSCDCDPCFDRLASFLSFFLALLSAFSASVSSCKTRLQCFISLSPHSLYAGMNRTNIQSSMIATNCTRNCTLRLSILASFSRCLRSARSSGVSTFPDPPPEGVGVGWACNFIAVILGQGDHSSF